MLTASMSLNVTLGRKLVDYAKSMAEQDFVKTFCRERAERNAPVYELIRSLAPVVADIVTTASSTVQVDFPDGHTILQSAIGLLPALEHGMPSNPARKMVERILGPLGSSCLRGILR